MPSSKSKKKEKKKKALRRLKSKLEKRRLIKDYQLYSNPSGREKMSEVLMRFAEPYAAFASTEEDYRNLFALAALAWNNSLLSKSEGSTLDDLIHEQIPWAENATKWIIKDLTRRKDLYFAEYSNIIVDYEVKITGDVTHLTVAYEMP
jgi:hypothetical protein